MQKSKHDLSPWHSWLKVFTAEIMLWKRSGTYLANSNGGQRGCSMNLGCSPGLWRTAWGNTFICTKTNKQNQHYLKQPLHSDVVSFPSCAASQATLCYFQCIKTQLQLHTHHSITSVGHSTKEWSLFNFPWISLFHWGAFDFYRDSWFRSQYLHGIHLSYLIYFLKLSRSK